MKNSISYADYAELLPVFVQYRNDFKKATRISTDRYCRLFTEKQSSGLRSKFWLFQKSDIKRYSNYVQKHPYIYCGDNTYKVSVELFANQGWYGGHSLALYVKKVKTEKLDIKNLETHTFDEHSKKFSLSDIMSMLPTYKEVEKYANGYFGYPDDYEDSRVISASEQAFVSGCDWMRSEIERKLQGN